MDDLGYFLKRRYGKTLSFLEKSVPPPAKVLDLGTPNRFSAEMAKAGYEVENTGGEDLDDDVRAVQTDKYDLVTSFELFEHMVSPYTLLKAVQAKHLVASVPLSQFYSKAYWSPSDPWDRHYHEFEPRQFDMLLEKAGWKIVRSELWTAPVRNFGIRPLLRLFLKRYYIVYCVRK